MLLPDISSCDNIIDETPSKILYSSTESSVGYADVNLFAVCLLLTSGIIRYHKSYTISKQGHHRQRSGWAIG